MTDPVCPCSTDVEEPGPHLITCPWANGEYAGDMEAIAAGLAPPFAANGIEDLECPACEMEGMVCAREQDSYENGEIVDAYCADCHTLLKVHVRMEPYFGDVRIADIDASDIASVTPAGYTPKPLSRWRLHGPVGAVVAFVLLAVAVIVELTR